MGNRRTGGAVFPREDAAPFFCDDYLLGELLGNYQDGRHSVVRITPALAALLAEYAFLDVDAEGHA